MSSWKTREYKGCVRALEAMIQGAYLNLHNRDRRNGAAEEGIDVLFGSDELIDTLAHIPIVGSQ